MTMVAAAAASRHSREGAKHGCPNMRLDTLNNRILVLESTLAQSMRKIDGRLLALTQQVQLLLERSTTMPRTALHPRGLQCSDDAVVRSLSDGPGLPQRTSRLGLIQFSDDAVVPSIGSGLPHRSTRAPLQPDDTDRAPEEEVFVASSGCEPRAAEVHTAVAGPERYKESTTTGSSSRESTGSTWQRGASPCSETSMVSGSTPRARKSRVSFMLLDTPKAARSAESTSVLAPNGAALREPAGSPGSDCDAKEPFASFAQGLTPETVDSAVHPSACSIDEEAPPEPTALKIPSTLEPHTSETSSSGCRASSPVPSGYRPSSPASTPGMGRRRQIRSSSSISSLVELEARTSVLNTSKMKLWAILTDLDDVSFMGRLYFKSMPYFILVSVITALGESLHPSLCAVNQVMEVVFVLDTGARLYAAPSKTAFLTSSSTWIDVCAGVPLILRRAVGSDVVGDAATVCTLLAHFIPFVRGCKFIRFFEKLLLLRSAFAKAKEGLPVCLYMFVLVILLFAPLVYVLEPRSNVDSMSSAFWFCVVTITTVGYGDIAPVTDAGRVVTSGFLFIAIIYMAIPLGIVGDSFAHVWAERDYILLRHKAREQFQQWGFSPRDVASLFELFADRDRREDAVELDLASFAGMMRSMRLGLPESRVEQLFRLLDVDGSGTLSDTEFVQKIFPASFHDIYHA